MHCRSLRLWYPQHYDSQLDRPPCHQLDGSAKFRETLLAPAVSVLRLKVVPQVPGTGVNGTFSSKGGNLTIVSVFFSRLPTTCPQAYLQPHPRQMDAHSQAMPGGRASSQALRPHKDYFETSAPTLVCCLEGVAHAHPAGWNRRSTMPALILVCLGRPSKLPTLAMVTATLSPTGKRLMSRC